MPHATIEVFAPSRLHFGLLSFGTCGARQFGGAGVMVERPGLRLRISRAERFAVGGPLEERVRAAAERFSHSRGLAALPACRVDVLDAPPEHVGLGTGTQLALSVVAGLNALDGGAALEPAELAAMAGRAARSAVGTYGFVLGGLIMESGKHSCEAIAPLERRLELPVNWRFVLVVPRAERGLSGEAEREAFDTLPPVPMATTAALQAELTAGLFPAIERNDFERFSQCLYRYGHTSGMCFAARQGGPFASPRVAELVERIRALGVAGVGQTSWGPTVFAAAASEQAGQQLCERLAPHIAPDDQVLVARPANSGARIEIVG